MLIPTHRRALSHLRGVGRNAPSVESVEEDHAALRVGPLATLEVKIDHDLLADLKTVHEVGAVVSQLEEHMLGILAARTRNFQNKLPHRKRLGTLHNIMNFLEFANYLHLIRIKEYGKRNDTRRPARIGPTHESKSALAATEVSAFGANLGKIPNCSQQKNQNKSRSHHSRTDMGDSKSPHPYSAAETEKLLQTPRHIIKICYLRSDVSCGQRPLVTLFAIRRVRRF